MQPPPEVKVSRPLSKKHVLTVRLRLTRMFHARQWLGTALLRLGMRILGGHTRVASIERTAADAA